VVPGEEVTEEEVYSGGDIYGKGSFFMHSLRYLIGDEVFFPTLKTLATDPQYTYDHFVTTTDVEKLFSSKSGKDLKPFFDFYLRTTQVLDVNIKEIGFQKYQIKVANLMMPLPFEVTANDKTSRLVMDNQGLIIHSTLPPQVDAKGYYLKKVTLQ
jgi:aminopeptidase N